MRLNKSKIFLITVVGFIAGVFERSFFELKNFHILFVVALAIILFIGFYKNRLVAVITFALLFFSLGLFITGNKLEKIDNIPAEEKSFSGAVLVASTPQIKEKSQQIIVGPSYGEEFKILVYTPLYPKFSQGDKLFLDCVLARPENFDEDFDWRMYLAKDSVYYQCQKPEVSLLEKGGGTFMGTLAKLSQYVENNINKVMPQPESALAAGLILGGSGRLSEKVSQNFSRTGMTHIVAVSGYNVTIIAQYLMIAGIFLGFWRKQAFYFAAAGIFLFVALTGFTPSGIRAAIMGLLILWAAGNGRLSDSVNALTFAAALMLLANPLILRWDIGFQLSFLATLGIILIYPVFGSITRNFKAFGILDIVFLTLSAQIFVLPIIAYNFNQVSVLSLLANLLILPVIPLAMLLIFLTALSGFVFHPLSLALSWITYPILKFQTKVVEILAGISWSAVEIKNIGWWWVAGFYAGLGVALILIRKNNLHLSFPRKRESNKQTKILDSWSSQE